MELIFRFGAKRGFFIIEAVEDPFLVYGLVPPYSILLPLLDIFTVLTFWLKAINWLLHNTTKASLNRT